MSRRRTPPKKRPPSSDKSVGPSSLSRDESVAAGMVVDPAPSPVVRWLLSFWVVFHLAALVISYTGVVEPSSLHARLMTLIHPYVRPTHFAADDRPVYLTHGGSDEQPHRIQVTTRPVTESDAAGEKHWLTVGPAEDGGLASTPGLAVSDRVARWLATAAMLSENDQPSMVADLLLPIAKSDPKIQAIRIVRYPTDLSDVTAEVEAPYVARVIRDGEATSLVQLKERRLSSVPMMGSSDAAVDSADGGQLEAGAIKASGESQ